MKKRLSLILAIFMSVTTFAARQNLNLDDLQYYSDDAGSTYNVETKTITFSAWGSRGWYYEPTMDLSDYTEVVVNFQSTNSLVKLAVQYSDGTTTDGYGDAGATSIKVVLDADKKNAIQQIQLQRADAGGLTLIEVYVSDGVDNESGTVIYESNFDASTDGWSVNKNDGAVDAVLNHAGNVLEVDITNSGNEGWHLQLAKTGIALKKGTNYKCTLSLSSTANGDVQFYLDDNGPSYQAFNPETFSVTETKEEFYSTFTYTEEDDNDTRIVFNLGGFPAAKFTLYSFKLENLEETSIHLEKSDSYKIYSIEGSIIIEGAVNESITVYSIDGRLINKTVGNTVTTISSGKGLYIVKVGDSKAQKIVVKR